MNAYQTEDFASFDIGCCCMKCTKYSQYIS